jgi:Ca2+-binding RTX toxin-like protein
LGDDLVGLRLFKDEPSENDKAHRLLAGMGDDVILGGSNTDVIVGNGGNDWIGGGAGSDILAAGSGDVASSGSNPDNIFGNVGSTYESTIVGGAGDDTLVAIEGNVIASGGEGGDTFAFYGAQQGLQTHLTITDFEIGIDRIDISKLLGEQWLTGSANLDGYLVDIITAAIVDADGVHLDLSSLMSDANSEGAQVQLTIEHASTQTVGADGAIEATVISGQNIKNALSTSVFETTSLASDMWFSDLAPLTYPSAI